MRIGDKVVYLDPEQEREVTNLRLHHKINWNKAVPKIIEEKFK